MNNFCECGCGKLVRFGWGGKILNRFVLGHNPCSEEHKRSNSIASTGNKYGLGYRHTEEAKRKIAKAGKMRPSGMLGKRHSKSTKRKMSKVAKERTDSKQWRRWMSRISIDRWADPEYKDKTVKAVLRGNHVKPNKPETQLLELLESIQPGDWKYVGDGSFIIGGKNPDFINVNGKKLVIEMWGDYWHRNDNPEDRIDIFKPFGFKTLIVWERELKDKTELIKRIRGFAK